MKWKNAYEDVSGSEIEVFVCERCGREHHICAGGDIACCPCEFEHEGHMEEDKHCAAYEY